MQSLRRAAARLALSSALAVAGGLVLVIGLGFVTASGWTWLAFWYGPVMASLVTGGIYLATGLILLLLARREPPPPPPRRMDGPEAMARVVEAFIGGIEAGVRARRRSRARDE